MAKSPSRRTNPNPKTDGAARPPRGPNRFKERELARALRAAKAAGGKRVEIDPGTGRISVIIDEHAEPEPSDTPERIISKL